MKYITVQCKPSNPIANGHWQGVSVIQSGDRGYVWERTASKVMMMVERGKKCPGDEEMSKRPVLVGMDRLRRQGVRSRMIRQALRRLPNVNDRDKGPTGERFGRWSEKKDWCPDAATPVSERTSRNSRHMLTLDVLRPLRAAESFHASKCPLLKVLDPARRLPFAGFSDPSVNNDKNRLPPLLVDQ